MTREPVWQDDPPFAVGLNEAIEVAKEWPAPATDAEVAMLGRLYNAPHRSSLDKDICSLIARIQEAEADELHALDLCSAAIEDYNDALARIKAEREQTIRECAALVSTIIDEGSSDPWDGGAICAREKILSLLQSKE